jgi:hypothetical protein
VKTRLFLFVSIYLVLDYTFKNLYLSAVNFIMLRNLKLIFRLIIVCLFPVFSFAQYTIQPDSLQTYINKLASADFKGREAGTLGGDLAKDYIIMQLKNSNIPFYIQNVPLVNIYNGKSYFYHQKDTLKEYKHFYIYSGKITGKLNPLKLSSAKILKLETTKDWKSNPKKFKGKWLLFEVDNKSDKRIDELIKEENFIQQNGALGLMISTNIETNDFTTNNKKTYLKQDLTYHDFPIILMNNQFAQKFFKTNKKISFTNQNTQFVNGYNIYTILKGKNSFGKSTLLSAHYDHLGQTERGIYYGADDNASGTAALMCIAQKIKNLQNSPQQNEEDIIVAWWTAEEKGLLGSRYFTENPPLDLSKIQTVINVDMIGRYDTNYNPPSNYIYVIGSNFISNQLHLANEEVNKNGEKLILDYTYNLLDHPEDLFQRSDQYNFHLQGIPSIFFFSGFHSDYHTIYDTSDKIDAKKASKIASHIFDLILHLSKTKNQIVR